VSDDAPPPPLRGPVAAFGGILALAGGATLLGVALLTTWSVVQRWLTSQPVPGDFELVSIGSGVAVLGFLAWGTVRRASITVDTFTTWLPRRAAGAVDAFWMLVWAATAALLAERLLQGARETFASGTTTMVLGLPTWWAVGLGALGFAATALAGLTWVARLARGRG
jgi:TRAP-type C4-dicarboxylate transport system permease small subunit